MTYFFITLTLFLGCMSPLLALGWALERHARTGCRCHSPKRYQRLLCAFLLDHGRRP